MTKMQRYVAAALVVFAVFVSSYVYAATRTAPGAGAAVPRTAAANTGAACACCSGSGVSSGPATKGEATVDGDVQRIDVDTADGAWDPGEIVLQAGVPAEITFAEGQGCLAQVVFPDLDIGADLTDGGATVRIPALDAGEYTFSCGMRMVFGKLTVR